MIGIKCLFVCFFDIVNNEHLTIFRYLGNFNNLKFFLFKIWLGDRYLFDTDIEHKLNVETSSQLEIFSFIKNKSLNSKLCKKGQRKLIYSYL